MKAKVLSVLSIFLVASIILGAEIGLASELSPTEKFKKEYDSAVHQEYLLDSNTGEKIYSAFSIDSAGNLVPITLDEYSEIIEFQNDSVENISSEEPISLNQPILRSPTTWKVYRYSGQKGKSVVNGSRVKVSPDLKGPGTISSGQSVTITHSFGGSFGTTLGDKIKASATFTWNKSAASSITFSGSFRVPSGKIGYVGFTPYLNKTWGTGYEDTMTQTGVISSRNIGTVYGLSPKKLSSGHADGVYTLVYK